MWFIKEPYTARASSLAINSDLDAADGLRAAEELEAFALELSGQGCSVCAGGSALDVWAAMASAAVGALPFGGAFDV